MGPLVEVTFSPHPSDRQHLAEAGHAWQPLVQKMMVDTGATLTVVEEVVPTFLNLNPIRFQEIEGVGGVVDCPVYRLSISIGVADDAGNSGLLAEEPPLTGRVRDGGSCGSCAACAGPPSLRALQSIR